MIWLAIGFLAIAALAPLAIALDRQNGARGTREMALALHRTQLADLERDLAEGRILPAEHANAVLEIQRRMLAAAEKPDRPPRLGSRAPVWAVLVLVPVAAIGLYLASAAEPGMPSATPGSPQAVAERQAEENDLVGELRDRLALMDPATDQARQGFVLLGNVEESRGHDAAAIAAWHTALASRFDPVLAVRTAQAAERLEGGLSASSEALLRRALAAAPADAPWREAVEDRLKIAKQQ